MDKAFVSAENFLGLRASLSHVALQTGYNFWEEYILRFLKTPPFKNLKVTRGLPPGDQKKLPKSDRCSIGDEKSSLRQIFKKSKSIYIEEKYLFQMPSN